MNKIKATALALLAATGVGAVGPIQEAEAGSKGRQNTAIALGAVAAYGVVKKKPLIAGLAGGGAIYSYMKSREDAKRERERSRRRVYYRRKNGRLVRYYR